MHLFFGLDLAGYSTGGSALAMAGREDGNSLVTIIEDHCFAQKASEYHALAASWIA